MDVNVPTGFVDKIISAERSAAKGDSSIFNQLNSAFESVDSLTDFAKNTLGLNGFEIQAENLAELKAKVMADLAHARAENHGFLKSTEGILAWLRNAIMSFVMNRCAQFNAEKLFELNEATTDTMKTALNSISVLITPDPSSAVAEEPQSGGEEGGGFMVSSQQKTEPLGIDQDILNHLKVLDTPRDGSCMLWSVLTGLPHTEQIAITNNQGTITDAKVLSARDTTIQELRQVISIEMLAEGKDVAAARKIEGGGFGAERIEPEQMKYIAKHLKKDIVIITSQGNQSIAYLCTKEGEFITSQGENFLSHKDRFQGAIRNGPAIFAQDGHARCLKYNAQAGE
ncbi:MAG: hypothetical protein LBB17_00255 [Puniceicoccales bacterium]|nr:hypothetical protein [Puniceicoccales bacterium]